MTATLPQIPQAVSHVSNVGVSRVSSMLQSINIITPPKYLGYKYRVGTEYYV